VIPGKQYKPEEFLKIAWRRRWIIVVPLVVAAVGTFAWTRTLPDVYRSEATVLIIPPQVSANVVRPTIDGRLKERIELMKRQILSRTRLERIIEELNLYRNERKEMLMDQVIDRMQKDANIVAGKAGRRQDPNNIVVSFDSEDPTSAMQVTERLASLLVKENMEGRSGQSESTIQFLQSQADESLRQLQELEGRLEAFKKAHAGSLPNQIETNLQLMNGARQEVQAMTEGISQDRGRQTALERTIADEMAFGNVTAGGGRGAGSGRGAANATPAQQLATAKGALEALRLRYTEDHPDVRTAKGQVAELEKKVEAEALQQPLTGTSTAALTPAEAERQKRLSKLRGDLQAIDREIKLKQDRMARAQRSLSEHEKRIQSAPALEAQMTDLMRNHGAMKNTYDGLVKKLQDARIASSLEERQVGEQFRISDAARRPERPRSPDRIRLNLIGACLGLGFGLAIAGLLEYRDTSVRTEEDVLVALSLPVLALVPTIRTSVVVSRNRRRRRWFLLGSSASAMIVLLLAAVAWKLRLFGSWIG
jgi:polysaccharide chain length determinant protein (PEP-CTERM system associated)